MQRLVAPALGLLALCAQVSAEAPKAAARPRGARAGVPRTSALLPPDPSDRDLVVGEACRKGLGGNQGAVVAMDPKTGRVLALINPLYGLLNAYQPCSVFKIVTAVAGLSEGVITPDTSLSCTKSCWSWPGHGQLNLKRALAVSCNPFFQQVGERVGFYKMQQYAQLLGLGAPTGINLDGESSGWFPTFVKPAGMALMSSHAEGIRTTPVQIATLLSATLNGGVLFQPQLASANDFVPRERWRLPEGTNLNGLAEGFMAAVNEGTASPAFDPEIVVAGKTGTCAGVGWFASYAPADKPEIVIVTFMRHGSGHGASAVAGRIYHELYRGQSAPAASSP
jgi:cell division protein FtsI/penicillin-binding protein 2